MAEMDRQPRMTYWFKSVRLHRGHESAQRMERRFTGNWPNSSMTTIVLFSGNF